MLFNSFTFFIFFITVFLLYSFLNHRSQNRLLLISSYCFYAAWDYRFLFLILTTTIVDYSTARLMGSNFSPNIRKKLLIMSITINLLILGFFKYFNFFIESTFFFVNSLGFTISPITLQIILPVGISFYTFQSMSYTIDVYRKEVKPVNHFLDYALYVSFFPQLVAGPIERAKHLLPQILSHRTITWDKIQVGAFYILFGLFLKVFMADNLARLVDPIYSTPDTQTGFSFLLAGYAFSFQIFGDFAGYSYISKGLGAILGFDIMDNFYLPYFSKNPQQFWRRWHISLSTWLRDYLYIPIGGSRGSLAKTIRALLITMLLGGLWHGAKITFVVWGLFHGLLLCCYHYLNRKHKQNNVKINNDDSMFIGMIKSIAFFHIIVISWYFFRADDLKQVFTIFHKLIFEFEFTPLQHKVIIEKLIFYVAPLLVFQFFQKSTTDNLFILKVPVFFRSILYVNIFYLIIIFGVTNAQEFIYFQF